MNEKLEELRKYMKSIDPEKHPNAVLMNSVDRNQLLKETKYIQRFIENAKPPLYIFGLKIIIDESKETMTPMELTGEDLDG